MPEPPARHHRRFGGSTDSPQLDFSRDYDHILYSSAFRRLGGVTQVVGPNEVTLCEAREDGLNAALNLTAATLAAILKYPWSDKRRPAGVSRSKKKWGYYDSEEHFFEYAMRGAYAGRTVELYNGSEVQEYRTVEAQVMDWADDISYAIHDVEDFFRAGLIPLDVLARSDGHFEDFFDYAWPRVSPLFVNGADEEAAKREIQGLIDNTRELLPYKPYTGTRNDRESLHKFASTIINRATDNVSLTEEGLVLPEKRELAIIETFKQLTWYYVIDQPALVSAQRGQVYLIRQLYRDLRIWVRSVYRAKNEDAFVHRPELPPRLFEYLEIAFSSDPMVGCANYDEDDQKINRAVVDYICSLTEVQAVQLSARLRGVTPTSMLESWIHL